MVIIKIASVILDIQNAVLSIAMMKFVALSSQVTAMHSIIYTAFVEGGKARGSLPPLPTLSSKYSMNLFRIDPTFSRQNLDHVV
jgi:hypothetical protein